MRLAITALTAALLLAGTASQAQDAAGTTDNRATAAEPGSAAVRPTVRPTEPKPRRDLLFDVIDVLTRPRPAPPTGPAAPPPVEPEAPVIAVPAPVPPRATIPPPPRSRPGFVLPAAVAGPRGTKPAPSPATKPPPRPSAPAAPAPPIAVAEPLQPPPPPPVSVQIDAAPTVPAPPAPLPSAAAPEPPAVPATQRGASMLSQGSWLLLALLAAVAAIAGGAALQRSRRIAHTRAALSLAPRLDLADGSCSVGGGALACPPMSIRTRLEFAGA